ncbi:hypothetical protein [Micromonospora aurantiaca (nom. illeg.)]|uniref:hypothetical protein n=1 Tax=Micromonospora aurantiaca (nom. illeg.) TaxID=47850 RepID=UPI00340675C2
MFNDRLAGILSSTIVRVRRINFVQPGGVRDIDEGPIEVTLDSGAVYRLESGDDGESLRLAVGEWVDSFAEPLSPENREFVARSGKWVAFDVSSDRDFCRLIGTRLDDLDLLITSGRIVGVELVFGLATLRAEVRGDELYVDFRDNHDR